MRKIALFVIPCLLFLSFSLCFAKVNYKEKTIETKITSEEQAVVDMVRNFADDIFQKGDRAYTLVYMNKWQLDQGNPFLLNYDHDEITIQTPYYQAVQYCYFTKKEFKDPSACKILNYFNPPAKLIIRARLHVNSIKGGANIHAAIKKGDKIIKPLKEDIENNARPSQFWPNNPAYVVINYYEFDLANFKPDDTFDLIINKDTQKVYKVDLSKLPDGAIW